MGGTVITSPYCRVTGYNDILPLSRLPMLSKHTKIQLVYRVACDSYLNTTPMIQSQRTGHRLKEKPQCQFPGIPAYTVFPAPSSFAPETPASKSRRLCKRAV